ncbi:MAG: ABC transporter substrate-binding protein [Candidatus Saccharibacteria bacterium]|nr:ABC transporter substrate-binding protein [Pseudorhodobacter sp.]
MHKRAATGIMGLSGFGAVRAGLAALELLGAAGMAQAQDAAVTVAHGISTFGTLKYPADFKHLDYVNPDAPKGGEIAEWAQGTFDSVNRFSIKGNAAGTGATPYESILTGTADEIGAMYCLLCETMEFPADRAWVIFNLRKDVKFSDGSPMTADDVLFSYNLFREKGIPEFRSVFNDQFAGVEVLDPYKIKFSFAPGIPWRDMPATAGGITVLSKADYETNKRNLEDSTLEFFLGTGPYVLDSMKVGQQIIFKRNPDYWGNTHPLSVGTNNFDRIRIEYFGDPTAAMEGFKAGVYTFRNENSSKQWATAYDFPAIANGSVKKELIQNGNIASGQAFLFNLRREKFQDIRVREAIALMFNFEWSNKTLFYGLYTRINSIWDNTQMAAKGPASPAEAAILQPLVDEGLLPATILTDDAVMAPTSDEASQLTRANLRAASKLLDEAGWTVGADGIRKNAKGEPLTVEFLNDSPAFDRVINPYVENLKSLGVAASLVSVDDAQYTNRVDPPSFDFDMITGNAINSYEPGSDMEQGYASKTVNNSSRNRMGLAHPAVDRLLEVVKAAKTREELDVATQALDRVLRSIRFWVPEWYKDSYTVAYYDVFDRPAVPATYALGETSWWWYDADKAAKLKAAGMLP